MTRANDKGRVAVVLKGYPRLSETFIAQELLALERAGLHLTLVSLRHPTDKKRHPVHDEISADVNYLPEYLGDDRWRVSRAVLENVWRPGFWRALTVWLRDFARHPNKARMRRFGQACVLAAELPRDVDRLYAHFIHSPASVTRYASLISGTPWSCSAHAKDIWTSADWELSEKLGSCEWTATCTAVGHAHLQSLSPEPDRVHLIYHGLDLDRFPPVEREPATRDGSQTGDPVRLISVGRAVPKKGFDTLLAALARLPADLAWTWTHIGGGVELEALKTQAGNSGVADRIEWRGAQAQSDVLAAYQGSDLFILPCRIAGDGDRDGLPNVLVEAQSQRLACISTTVSAIPELIDDGKTGRLVPPDDPDALAVAIEELAKDPKRRDELAQVGEQRVRRHFDHHSGIALLLDLFETGFGSPKPAARDRERSKSTATTPVGART